MSALGDLLTSRIGDFEWSVRTGTCLRSLGVVTVGDLVEKTQKELLRQPNFGEKSLIEVKGFLVDRGLRLGIEPARKPRISKIRSLPRPLCTAAVRVSSIDTIIRRIRVMRTTALGQPIDQCSKPGAYLIDGVNLCLSHAGQRAIEILETI